MPEAMKFRAFFLRMWCTLASKLAVWESQDCFSILVQKLRNEHPRENLEASLTTSNFHHHHQVQATKGPTGLHDRPGLGSSHPSLRTWFNRPTATAIV